MAPWNYLTNIKNTTESFSIFFASKSHSNSRRIFHDFVCTKKDKSSVTCATENQINISTIMQGLCYTINYCLRHCFHMRTFQTPENKTKNFFSDIFINIFCVNFSCIRRKDRPEQRNREKTSQIMNISFCYSTLLSWNISRTKKIVFLMCLCK